MRKSMSVAAVVLLLGACGGAGGDGERTGAAQEARNHGEQLAGATFVDTDGDTVGTALLTQGPAGVLLRLELDGLAPGWKAIHIHGKGTCDDHHDGFSASGGHFDPDDRAHGLLNADGPERGDLPNIWVHDDGVLRAEIYAPGVGLDPDGALPALLGGDGTALVIHENRDDHRSQPIGGAGARVACGVIEAAGS